MGAVARRGVYITMSRKKERIEAMGKLGGPPVLSAAEVSAISAAGKMAHFRYYDILMTARFSVAESSKSLTLKGATFSTSTKVELPF